MTKNKLSDLNDHLFMAMERLNDESLADEEIKKETSRAKAIVDIGRTIIQNGELVLNAHRFKDNQMDVDSNLPEMLEGGRDVKNQG